MKNSLYIELPPESKYIIECLKVQTRKTKKDLIIEAIYALSEKYGIKFGEDNYINSISISANNWIKKIKQTTKNSQQISSQLSKQNSEDHNGVVGSTEEKIHNIIE